MSSPDAYDEFNGRLRSTDAYSSPDAYSHGAVTARELNLPAVMSIRGVMTILQNGMMVKLDGKNEQATLL